MLKNFESVLRLLSQRGHEVELMIHRRADDPKLGDLVGSLVSEPGVSLVKPPPKMRVRSREVERAGALRASLDYLRLLEPRFSPVERQVLSGVPTAVRRAAELPLLRTQSGRRLLRRAVAAAELTVRVDPKLVRFLQRRKPDIVLFTPYVLRRSPPRPVDFVQPELLRAARRLDIPTVVCVQSWDHLTLKSSLSPRPDRVFVWNEMQRREARELHDLSPKRVFVTGAQCYDEWMDWPPRSRGEFCAHVGLDPDRPYVLYTGFTPSRTGPSEVEFVLRWLEALRADSDPVVSRAGVLVRPHPGRIENWRDADVSQYGNVVIFPRDHGFPTDAEAKSDYYDSIYHSAAVVGLGTSAMLEAALIGRPVLTILAPEFKNLQMDRPHFRYLREVAGGVVHAADGLDEHVRLLRRALGPEGAEMSRAATTFVREFLRPRGLDVDATAIFVDEVERFAAAKNGLGRA